MFDLGSCATSICRALLLCCCLPLGSTDSLFRRHQCCLLSASSFSLSFIAGFPSLILMTRAAPPPPPGRTRATQLFRFKFSNVIMGTDGLASKTEAVPAVIQWLPPDGPTSDSHLRLQGNGTNAISDRGVSR